MSISLDYSYLLSEAIGDKGITISDLEATLRGATSLYEKVQAQKKDGSLGFTKLPYQASDELTELKELARTVRSECKNLVVVGIGGSDLGARAVHRALNHQFYNMDDSLRSGNPRLFFLGDTTDPVALQEVLDVVDLKETIITVISKSGNTVEQMSTFIYLRSLLITAVGEEQAPKHIIILTDPETGTLREIVKEEGYRSLAIPSDVGGRFSVFSSVGLFPLAVVGIDIEALLEGAKAVDMHDSKDVAENLPFTYAALQVSAYKAGKPISVIMPYSYALRETGLWFRQLWAESLGKKVNAQGEVVHVGPTPVAAVGPTDQHSQVQLYMEGPYDKVITFVTIGHSSTGMVLPEAFATKEGVAYLKGHSFTEILAAEHASTAYALASAQRASCTLSLSELTARSMGELLYFFEMAVTYAGEMLNINTFDQPGVEIGKEYMYGLLGRPGFENRRIPQDQKSAIISL